MVERGFATLALVAQCWEDSAPEGSEENESYVAWVSRRTTIAKAFSDLLQRAWFKPFQSMVSLIYICNRKMGLMLLLNSFELLLL